MSIKADCGSNKGICSLDQEIDESDSHLDLAASEGTHQRQKSASLDGLWAKQQLLLPPQMTTKVKGLFKGLRYISQIFEQPNMKEQEMQIGYPTDVKHVAHIGWDGPSVTAPSWMNEFRSTPEFNSTPVSSIDDGKELGSHAKAKLTSQADGMPASPTRDAPELPKASRRHQTSVDSASREGSGAPRQSRRGQQTSGDSSVPRQSRRHHSSTTHDSSGGGGGTESPTKACRRRKPKNGAGGGSSPAGRTKALASAGADQDARTQEQAPDLKSTVEEEGN